METERLNPANKLLIRPRQYDASTPRTPLGTNDSPSDYQSPHPRAPTFLEVLPQILASCISLSSVPHAGINLAFSGVLIPQLENDPTIHGFSKESASWIASVVAIAQPIGALFVGPIMDLIGRKNTCIATNIPVLLGWGFVYFANSNLWPIYIGRLLCGFGSGMSTVGLVYTAEIAHSRYRPMLLSLNSVNVAFGILLTTLLGVFFNWHTCALIFGAMAFFSLCLSFLLPESPHWLVNFTSTPKETVAKHLRLLNRSKWLFDEEWERLQASVAMKSSSEVDQHPNSTVTKLWGKITEFSKPSAARPLTVLFIIFFLQQTCGTYVVIFYTVNIFRSLGGNFGFGFDEYSATIALGVLRFVMSLVSAVLSKIMGRRPIMIISSVGMGLSCLGAAACLHLNHITTVSFNGTRAAHLSEGSGSVVSSWWILLFILLFVCAGSVGHMVIPWTLMGELLPTQIRASGSGLMVSYSSLLLFVVVKTFPGLLDYTTLPVLFTSYAVMAFVSALYVKLYLPETFRKNFIEIAQMFERRKRFSTNN